jgi:hypothetical protein
MATNQELGMMAGEKVTCETRRQFERAGFTIRKIAQELALIAFSDIQDYIKINEGGMVEAYPLDQLKKGKSRAIKKVREKRRILNTPGDKEDVILDATYEFELYDKLSSLDLAVAILGIKKPTKVELNGKFNIDITESRRILADKLGAIIEREGKG